MKNQSFGSGSPVSFHPYTRGEFDLESGNSWKSLRKPKNPPFVDPIRMIKSVSNRIRYFYKLHPVAVFLSSLFFGVTVLVVLSLYERKFQMVGFRRSDDLALSSGSYPFPNLHNLVMVAGHSIYTSTRCGKFDNEDSWYLEPYQKNPGQAATFLAHIQVGVESAAKDEGALLLFSGGETRKDGGPRSEAQSYWFVAESEGWFGHTDSIRSRALTEEHARDSFENLLFSVCCFRELTGSYPQNITVISYDFKRERFAQLHRPAIGFPEGSFFYIGTPAAPGAQEAAEKGEALAMAQFQEDPYGCFGTLHRKRLTRDPFHRFVPYPNGCPELKGLFSYCGPAPFPGWLPWTK
ncbi:uncharacterized protein C57A10.07-like [Zingiber officinale]|uniref:DUF218 domain-containing protein n=1 Tax=Zingiber officinale TaxID=94328 RepID=A0A8J5G111_ZINOF|nr:uncharacterized protein C57A10.07-like [Zingiber officinale]KAG6494082.1 hypothetical protein ZIOFF_049101 [Zingiber officinale]